MKMNICIIILNSYRYLLILRILQTTGSHPCVKLYCYVDAQLFLVEVTDVGTNHFQKIRSFIGTFAFDNFHLSG